MNFLARYSFLTPLIKMREFVLTKGWMVQTTTLCLNLVLRQRHYLNFLKATRIEPQPTKLLVPL